MDFTKALPSTEKYIHFGKGRMETVLDLPPGNCELRPVLADQGHIPYFVYSKVLSVSVTVKARHKDVPPARVLGAPRVETMGVAESATLQPPFRIQFHASGYNAGAQRHPARGRGCAGHAGGLQRRAINRLKPALRKRPAWLLQACIGPRLFRGSATGAPPWNWTPSTSLTTPNPPESPPNAAG